ncbi:hypothetical protein BRC81_03405 [Halobacteriales archaeon QS_1_68_20]|nr:MAG: hypothetical protein BRC81_03405 [Halobacteriales archaeon QS_1_68_20]
MVDSDDALVVTPLVAVPFVALLSAGPLFDGWLVDWLHSSLPAWTSYLFAAATLFGEPWVFVPVLAAAYWFGDPDRIAPLFGLVFGGLALALVLKAALALPRPTAGPMIPVESAPESIRGAYDWTIHADGYGFPSAHSIGAVLAWGGLAGALQAGTRRTRIWVAGAFVTLAGLSRLGLGVHYAVDVVGGTLIGVAMLYGWWAASRRVRRPVVATFGVALACAALPVVLGVGGDDSLYAPRRSFRPGFVGVVATAAGIVWFLGAGGVVGSVEPGTVGSVATTATMGVAIFSWPVAVGAARTRLERARSHG